MSRHIIWFGCLATLLCAANPATAGVDAQLEQLLQGTSVTPALSGLQISLLEQGEPTASYALGFAQITADGPIALRTDHKVRVASISKLVLAIGIMRLVESGALDLDVDVSTYLGWTLRNPRFPEHAITTRQLLSHTSSIRDGSSYFIKAGEGELRDFFDPADSRWDGGARYTNDQSAAPGTFFHYANLNFGLLATVIEQVTQQRFDQFMTQQVLAPMGLTARFSPCHIPKAQVAAGYRKRSDDGHWNPKGPWIAQVDSGELACFYGMRSQRHARSFLKTYEPGSNASLFSPQGGLRASANDLREILRMLAANGELNGQRILQPNSIEQMLQTQWTLNARKDNGRSSGENDRDGPTAGLMTRYGLSVHRINLREWGFNEGPHQLVGHLGNAYGVLSFALFDPSSGDGITAIITGTADNPSASHFGHSPLTRIQEEILRWWLSRARHALDTAASEKAASTSEYFESLRAIRLFEEQHPLVPAHLLPASCFMGGVTPDCFSYVQTNRRKVAAALNPPDARWESFWRYLKHANAPPPSVAWRDVDVIQAHQGFVATAEMWPLMQVALHGFLNPATVEKYAQRILAAAKIAD